MLGQHRIAPAGLSGDLLSTPGRNQQILLGRCQLHLGQHQGSVLSLETIHHPVTTRAIQGVADFVQAVGRQIPKGFGIRHRDRIFELMAHQANGISSSLQGEPGLIRSTQAHPHCHTFGTGGQIALTQRLCRASTAAPGI